MIYTRMRGLMRSVTGGLAADYIYHRRCSFCCPNRPAMHFRYTGKIKALGERSSLLQAALSSSSATGVAAGAARDERLPPNC